MTRITQEARFRQQMMQYLQHHSAEETARRYRVSRKIAVATNFKGKGIGYALMKFAEEYAASHGKGGLTLITHVVNLRGQALYAKCGFERIGIHGATGQIFYIQRFRDPDFC